MQWNAIKFARKHCHVERAVQAPGAAAVCVQCARAQPGLAKLRCPHPALGILPEVWDDSGWHGVPARGTICHPHGALPYLTTTVAGSLFR